MGSKFLWFPSVMLRKFLLFSVLGPFAMKHFTLHRDLQIQIPRIKMT